MPPKVLGSTIQNSSQIGERKIHIFFSQCPVTPINFHLEDPIMLDPHAGNYQTTTTFKDTLHDILSMRVDLKQSLYETPSGESTHPTLLGVYGSPPSTLSSHSSSSLEDSFGEESSSLNNSHNSQGSPLMANNYGNNKYNQGNNPATPWLDHDVVTVPGVQHPLPKYPHKFLHMFDLDSKQSTDEHINAFILAIMQNNMHHEYIFCRLFLYTFEGKATPWYFSQPLKVSRLGANLKLPSWKILGTKKLQRYQS